MFYKFLVLIITILIFTSNLSIAFDTLRPLSTRQSEIGIESNFGKESTDAQMFLDKCHFLELMKTAKIYHDLYRLSNRNLRNIDMEFYKRLCKYAGVHYAGIFDIWADDIERVWGRRVTYGDVLMALAKNGQKPRDGGYWRGKRFMSKFEMETAIILYATSIIEEPKIGKNWEVPFTKDDTEYHLDFYSEKYNAVFEEHRNGIKQDISKYKEKRIEQYRGTWVEGMHKFFFNDPAALKSKIIPQLIGRKLNNEEIARIKREMRIAKLETEAYISQTLSIAPYFAYRPYFDMDMLEEDSGIPTDRVRPLINKLKNQAGKDISPAIWHIDSTKEPGGVSAMFANTANLLGLDERWFVLTGNDMFFDTTEEWYDILHGKESKPTSNRKRIKQRKKINKQLHNYRRIIESNVSYLLRLKGEEHLEDPDFIMLYDLQSLGMINELKEVFPKTRFIFVDRSNIAYKISYEKDNSSNRMADFFSEFINKCDGAVFSMPENTFTDIKIPAYYILPSSINTKDVIGDSRKIPQKSNAELAEYMREVLGYLNLFTEVLEAHTPLGVSRLSTANNRFLNTLLEWDGSEEAEVHDQLKSHYKDKNIAFFSFRMNPERDKDGVAFEALKWMTIFDNLGANLFCLSGDTQLPFSLNVTSETLKELHFKIRFLDGENKPTSDFSRAVYTEYKSMPELTKIIFEKGEIGEKEAVTLKILTAYIKSRLIAYIKENNIDVAIAENIVYPGNLAFSWAFAEAVHELEKEELGIEFIFHNHDYLWGRIENHVVNGSGYSYHVKGGRLKYVLDRIESAMQHATVFNINTLQKEYVPKPYRDNILVAPNVMPFAENSPPKLPKEERDGIREELGIAPEDFLIILPVRIIPRKNLPLAIKKAKQLKEEISRREELSGRKVHIILPQPSGDEGNGSFEDLEERAKKAGIHIINASGKIDLGLAYLISDIVLYPSTWEGFGNAAIEAAYYGIPIMINRYLVYLKDIKPKGLRYIEINNTFSKDAVSSKEDIDEMLEVLTDEKKREEITQHNYRVGKKWFSYAFLERIFLSSFVSTASEEYMDISAGKIEHSNNIEEAICGAA